MRYKGLIPPARAPKEEKTVVVRITEDEWESLQELRRESYTYDLEDDPVDDPYDTTVDMPTDPHGHEGRRSNCTPLNYNCNCNK